jgi:hypothetical protein
MTYKLTTKGNNLEVTLTKNELITTVEKPEYTISLARTGGQGSKGDSITNVYLNEEKYIVVEVTSSSGVTTELFAGPLTETLSLDELTDVVVVEPKEGDFLSYDQTTETFKNHKLTTSRLADVDNTNKVEGALLVYSSSSEKYKATNQLNNSNTLILGGTF